MRRLCSDRSRRDGRSVEMKQKNRQEMKRRMAAIIALLLAVIMALGMALPFLGGSFY